MTALRPLAAATAVALIGAGVPLLGASSSQASVAPLGSVVPWDFDGNGHADLAVGAPGENVGSDVDAGAVSVFMANASGAYAEASKVWKQGADGVKGAAEAGDQFGYALTSGDYDGDGYADLAIASNREDVGSGSSKKVDSGTVTVLWGSTDGLTGEGSVVLKFDPSGTVYAGTYFGDGLASGDMNGDGSDELAIGAPGRDQVRVYEGDPADPFGSWTTFSEKASGVPGKKRSGDLFGESLAMGNFNGSSDPYADLVVGIPYDSDDRGFSVGAVLVVPGSASGPNLSASTRWSPETKGIKGKGHTFTVNDLPDSFGRTLATGDFDGDGVGDLAVGAPGSPVTRANKKKEDAGRVHVLFGSDGGLTTRDSMITQETSGVPGKSGKDDLFGASLDGGDRGAKAKDLLAIGSAEESVRVLIGASGNGAVSVNQDSQNVPGKTEKGDAFGSFVRFLNLSGDEVETLAVSAPGEDSSAGAVFLLPGNGTTIVGAGSEKLDEDSANATGKKENGDVWGWLGDSH